MLRLRLLHSIFKASLLRHSLKTLAKLLIKLNRIYVAYYVPKIFQNFFHRLRKCSVKDAITNEIIVVLNWFIHMKVFIVKTFYKRKFYFLQHFSSCLRRLSNHVKYVTIICITKFKGEFQKYEARKCNIFYWRKRVKGRYFWKTSFLWHKLVIRTNFKHQIQYVACVTCKICLISIKHYLI